MSGDSKNDTEYVRNLVALWTHQNTVVYGRLTTISAIQAAVFAGWYTASKATVPAHDYACAVGVAGTVLAWTAFKLVDCDLRWKMHFGDRLRAADSRLLPPRDVGTLAGWKLMKGVFISFIVVDFILSGISLLRWL